MRSRTRLILAAAALPALALATVAAWSALRPASEQAASAEPDWGDALAALRSDAAFEPLPPDWNLSLPADHGAHPAARAESWAVTAHLTDETGSAVGIQVVLSRYALSPPGAEPEASPWTPRALHRGHVTLTDAARGAAEEEERFSRGALGAAGHDPATGALALDHWRLDLPRSDEEATLSLSATVGATAVALRLEPVKTPLGTGPGAGPFRGYAVTRMQAVGTVERDGVVREVSGPAWLDHLWGDLPPPGGPVVWDRLQLHLSDGSEVSATRQRRRDGGGSPGVAGFVVTPDGEARSLDAARMTAVGSAWTPPGGTADYPLDWRLEGDGLDLRVTPAETAQRRAFAEPVWSGLVRAEGRAGDAPVSGVGTLNLTGYETP